MSCASMQNKFSVNSELIPYCGVPWDCQRLDFLIISQLQVYPLGGKKKKISWNLSSSLFNQKIHYFQY